MKQKATTVCKRIILFIAIIIGWKIASNYVNPMFIPDPIKVWDDFVIVLKDGSLWKMIWYSFRRITVATLIAGVIAIPVGLLNYNIPIIHDIVDPIISMMRFIPVTAFYPLLIMWFGIDDKMKIAFLFIAVFVYMMPSVVLSLDEIDKNIIDTGLTMGMSKWKTIYMIQLPAALPSIMKSFIMMFGIGWSYIAVAETVNAVYGLGYTIQQSSSRGRTDMVFMAIIVIIVISILFDALANFIVKKVFKWRYIND